MEITYAKLDEAIQYYDRNKPWWKRWCPFRLLDNPAIKYMRLVKKNQSQDKPVIAQKAILGLLGMIHQDQCVKKNSACFSSLKIMFDVSEQTKQKFFLSDSDNSQSLDDVFYQYLYRIDNNLFSFLTNFNKNYAESIKNFPTLKDQKPLNLMTDNNLEYIKFILSKEYVEFGINLFFFLLNSKLNISFLKKFIHFQERNLKLDLIFFGFKDVKGKNFYAYDRVFRVIELLENPNVYPILAPYLQGNSRQNGDIEYDISVLINFYDANVLTDPEFPLMKNKVNLTNQYIKKFLKPFHGNFKKGRYLLDFIKKVFFLFKEEGINFSGHKASLFFSLTVKETEINDQEMVDWLARLSEETCAKIKSGISSLVYHEAFPRTLWQKLILSSKQELVLVNLMNVLISLFDRSRRGASKCLHNMILYIKKFSELSGAAYQKELAYLLRHRHFSVTIMCKKKLNKQIAQKKFSGTLFAAPFSFSSLKEKSQTNFDEKESRSRSLSF